jgi:hypothetical protein
VPPVDAVVVTTNTAEVGNPGNSGPLRESVSGWSAPLALAIGSARVAVGVTYLAAPVNATRMLGVDGATATRVAWLARMTAARDLVLGAGTVVATMTSGRNSAWLAAGMVCDAVDAAVIAAAARQRRLDRLRAAVAVTAAVAGVAGGAVALALPAVDALRNRG